MITREEYEKTVIRMFDSIRIDDDYKGEKSCKGVDCSHCPFKDKDCYLSNAFEAIETVEKWGKEHPLITMEDKFIEVFGRRPTNEYGRYCCPYKLGFKNICGLDSCDECPKNFWKSEYKAPKRK